MPTNYGVVGPGLEQYGADTQYASPFQGLDDTSGGTGGGFLAGAEELRRRREQDAMRTGVGRNQMINELMKILRNIETPPNVGLGAGGGMGQFRNQQGQFFSGGLSDPSNLEAPGPSGSSMFGAQLDGMLGGIPGIGMGSGGVLGGSSFGGFDVGPSATTPYGGGGANFNLGGFGMGGLA